MKTSIENKSYTAYEFIKNKILNNEYECGEIISEKQVARDLQMSRTPVRSAFQKLESEGFLRIVPARGAIVQEMSIKEAKEIYDLRIAVETFVMKKAFSLISQKDIDNLRNIIIKQKCAFQNDDMKNCIKHDIEFHAYFLNLYRNDKIKEIVRNFRERFSAYGYIALIKPGRIYTTLKEHEEIVKALEKKDLELTIQKLENHLENGKKHILLQST